MNALRTIQMFLDYLGGSREELPASGPGHFLPRWLATAAASTWFKGLWWIFLLVVVLFFSGQTSKFIYIDF